MHGSTAASQGALIEVGGVASDSAPIFFVRDNGVGFDIGSAEKLFRPFQRFHSSTEFAGTGIGLATCRRIVRRHGSSIWVTSALGEGTAVFFNLGRSPRGCIAEGASEGLHVRDVCVNLGVPSSRGIPAENGMARALWRLFQVP